MFKGILPKRTPEADFTMVTPPPDDAPNGKENRPDTKRKSTHPATLKVPKGSPESTNNMEQAFDQLLDDLQIPPTLRPKLATMESSVKAAMLKSHTLKARTPTATTPVSAFFEPSATASSSSAGPTTPRSLRRTRSIDSPHPEPEERPRSRFGVRARSKSRSRAVSRSENPQETLGSGAPSMHARGKSFDLARLSTTDLSLPPAKQGKAQSAQKIVSVLTGTSSTTLDVEHVKKLRLLLRNESAAWTADFIARGGYSALLTRLNELLEVEWREEQHDDQLLHALLLCVKALGTSAAGIAALRSTGTTPWSQLLSLLYSDKKPGEVATREVMVELLLQLFDLYPASAVPADGRRRAEVWEDDSRIVRLPAPHTSVFSLMRGLLLTPAPRAVEAPEIPVEPHDFIENLHTPRIYKAYLQELSDLCRDYFWIFCHPNNTIWNLREVDEARVEKPRAPGGMTGGVEYEAIGYMTQHFRLINACARAAAALRLPKDHDLSAHRFHTDLFLSGLERILLVARKASTTYYPALHLEIARYAAEAGLAGFEMPWTVGRVVGAPPSGCCKPGVRPPTTPSRRERDQRATPKKTPVGGRAKGASPPGLPSPVKVEPIKFA